MKKLFLLLSLGVTSLGYTQINLNGDTYYTLNISGYMGRGKDACGDIDGLRNIDIKFNDGTSENIFSGRKIDESFYYSRNYTKNKPITQVIIHKVVRWKISSGCNGGPGDRYNVISNITPIFSNVTRDAGDGLINLSISSSPYITLQEPFVPLYLSENENLKITLPDNINNNYYRWCFRAGNGPIQVFPSKYNNNAILNIKGKEFLSEYDYGKTISVWIQYEYGGITTRKITSNAISFTYLKSAPNIISSTRYPTTCYDTADGAVKIQFDRPLSSGENLSIALKNTTTNTNNSYTNILHLNNDNSYTITNLPVGTYKVDLLGFYNDYNTYTDGANHKTTFEITKPVPVDFTIVKTINVWCHNGNDGEIHFRASGGIGRYEYTINDGAWQPFSNGAENIIKTLLPGTYTIKVRDTNGCIARIQKIINGQIHLGENKIEPITIKAPSLPLSIIYTALSEPSFHGGSNGKIVAKIDGGTIFDNQSYQYEWKNSKGIIQTNTTTQFVSGSYYITLNQIPSDTYSLTIKDKNYNNATNSVGCTIINSEQFLAQPEKIKVKLEIIRGISCNMDNEFGNETDNNPYDKQRDESQDGLIKATVTGGVPLNRTQNKGLPYYYTWKKQLPDGSWIDWKDTDSIARYLSHGTYALNIEDKNGIKLGTYTNNILTQAIDSTIAIQQPSKLVLNFTSENVICNIENNGKATVHIAGGSPPYQYQWSTGATTQTIENLFTGNYLVYVTDSKGCRIEGNILIKQPDGITVTETINHPTCYEATNGKITLNITGGVAPYTYSWSNGAITQNIEQLKAGKYSVTIKDANNCTFYTEYTLVEPSKMIIDLGEDRTLCNGQSHILDATIADAGASYQWTSTNGFTATTPTITITEAGNYNVTVTSSLGCIGTGQVNIITHKIEIDSEFFITSQAYIDEEVILINVSLPLGEKTEWIIPEGVEIIEQETFYTALQFHEIGNHQISLKQTQGDCYALYTKNIIVEQHTGLPNLGTVEDHFIQEFTVSPNPNNGNFQALVQLSETSPIHLRLFSMVGQNQIISKKETNQKNYTINFNINVPSGTYILILETAKKTEIKKIIII